MYETDFIFDRVCLKEGLLSSTNIICTVNYTIREVLMMNMTNENNILRTTFPIQAICWDCTSEKESLKPNQIFDLFSIPPMSVTVSLAGSKVVVVSVTSKRIKIAIP